VTNIEQAWRFLMEFQEAKHRYLAGVERSVEIVSAVDHQEWNGGMETK